MTTVFESFEQLLLIFIKESFLNEKDIFDLIHLYHRKYRVRLVCFINIIFPNFEGFW